MLYDVCNKHRGVYYLVYGTNKGSLNVNRKEVTAGVNSVCSSLFCFCRVYSARISTVCLLGFPTRRAEYANHDQLLDEWLKLSLHTEYPISVPNIPILTYLLIASVHNTRRLFQPRSIRL